MLVQIKYCHQYVVKSVCFGVFLVVFFSFFFSIITFLELNSFCVNSVCLTQSQSHCSSVSYLNKCLKQHFHLLQPAQ